MKLTRSPFAAGFSLVSLVSLVATLGCNSTDSGTIQIITDDEAGTFTRSPAPTTLSVVATGASDTDGGVSSVVLATASLPTRTLDLGQLDESASAVSLSVSGTDAMKTQRVFGASLPVQYGALVGQTIPIFVQRDGEMARLPGPQPDGRQAPTLALLQGEYLIVAGGNDPALAATTQLFDFGAFAPLGSPPVLPIAPQSLALSGTITWLINDTAAEYYDFSASETAPLALPAGGTFSDVAGGATIVDTTGVEYIVGATRLTGAATDKVLKVDPTNLTDTNYPYGETTWLTLSAPRLGAAAVWMPDYGLVVTGGSNTAAGVEVIKATDTQGLPLNQFAPDETLGAGSAALDADHVLLAGGLSSLFADPGVRALDLACIPTATAPCDTMTPWTALPLVLASAQTFTWSGSSSSVEDALVIGNEFGSGATHVYRLSPGAATEVPTRSAHVNARAAWSPVGSIVLFGGANVLESFIP